MGSFAWYLDFCSICEICSTRTSAIIPSVSCVWNSTSSSITYWKCNIYFRISPYTRWWIVCWGSWNRFIDISNAIVLSFCISCNISHSNISWSVRRKCFCIRISWNWPSRYCWHITSTMSITTSNIYYYISIRPCIWSISNAWTWSNCINSKCKASYSTTTSCITGFSSEVTYGCR